MEPNEIVRALQDGNACAECQHHGEPCGCNRPEGTCDAWNLGQEAADCIERLQAQLENALERNKRLSENYDSYSGSALERADKYIEELEATVKQLGARLSESQRQLRAAIEILNSIEWVGSGAKGRIEGAINVLRGPEQER